MTGARKPKRYYRKPSLAGSPLAKLSSGEIAAGHVKVAMAIPVTRLPLDLVIAEPSPQPAVTLHLVSPQGVRIEATVAGKSFRRCLKAIVADGPMREDQFAVVQGRLGTGNVLEEVGLIYQPRSAGDGE